MHKQEMLYMKTKTLIDLLYVKPTELKLVPADHVYVNSEYILWYFNLLLVLKLGVALGHQYSYHRVGDSPYKADFR